jgi:hypothetical protein
MQFISEKRLLAKLARLQVPLAFELFPANAMYFIPVKFSQPNTAVA